MSGSTKGREIICEEERQTMIVPIVLYKTDVSVKQEHVVIPDDPNQPLEPNIETSFRRLYQQCDSYQMIMFTSVRAILHKPV